MKKRYLIVLLFSFIYKNCLGPTIDSGEMVYDKLEGVPTITEIIKKDLATTKDGLSEALDLIKNMKSYLKKASYYDSKLVAIEKSGEGGIYLNFGYRSHGELVQPFTGFKTTIDFEKIPNWLETAFINTLSSPSIGMNSLINISAKNEFLIKLILLFSDVNNKVISIREAKTEILFLLYRLSLVNTDEFDSLLDKDGIFYKLISSVKINGKAISEFLNDYWNRFKEITNYNFRIEEASPYSLTANDLIESSDWATIFKISSAIGLKTAVECYLSREQFLKTTRGIELNSKIINSKTKRERVLNIKEFLKSLPNYNDIVDLTKKRAHGLLRRIKGIRKNWNKIVDKLRPILEPYFDAIGLPFDLIIRTFNDIEGMDASERYYDESSIVFDSDSSDIDFYSEDEFSFSDF